MLRAKPHDVAGINRVFSSLGYLRKSLTLTFDILALLPMKNSAFKAVFLAEKT